MKLTNIIKESKTIQLEDDPCWKNYQQIGTKMKDGKEVPNCVPKNEMKENVSPRIARGKDTGDLVVKHGGNEYIVAFSADGFQGAYSAPYAIWMPDSDTTLSIHKDAKGKRLWAKLKPMVDKYLQSVNEVTHTSQPGEWAGFIEKSKSRGKKLMGIFKTARAAKMWLNKNSNSLLNTDDVERVGIMTKGDWDSKEAKWAVENVNESKYELKSNTFRDYDSLYLTPRDSVQFKKDGSNFLVRYVSTHSYRNDELFKLGFGSMRDTSQAGVYGYTKNSNWHDLKLNKAQFEKLLNILDKNWKSYAKSFADFYKGKDINDNINEMNVNKKFGSKYDIGAGSMGSGTTFWNRAQEVRGDYKTIAHVSDSGKVTFYDKKLPNDVKTHIEDYAKTKSVNEGKMSDINLIAKEAANFNDFVKQFYIEYSNFPKTVESKQWLKNIYTGKTKMESVTTNVNENCGCGGAKTTNPYSLSEFVVNEGRNIQKIQKDYNDTVLKLKSTLEKYKEAKGTPNEKKWIDELKKLTVLKKKYQSELDKGVQSLYKDAEYEGE